MSHRNFHSFVDDALDKLRFGHILAAKFKKELADCRDVEDHVDLAFSFNFGPVNIKPYQIRWEITELLKLLNARKPRAAIEIGTANGGTLFLLSTISRLDAEIVSIDLPYGSFGGGYPEWKIPLFNSFARGKQKMHLIRGNSHDLPLFSKVEKLLDKQRIDFLFIDGDHTYNGVKKDFEMYSQLVDSNGIIVLHDIASGPYEKVGGVPLFWKELKKCFNFVEIIAKSRILGFGIGVIYL